MCPTLRDPIDGSPPGSFIHGIFQARVLGDIEIEVDTDMDVQGDADVDTELEAEVGKEM